MLLDCQLVGQQSEVLIERRLRLASEMQIVPAGRKIPGSPEFDCPEFAALVQKPRCRSL